MNATPSGSSIANTVLKKSKRTITEVTCYEITDGELDRLQGAISSSTDSLTFASIGIGIFMTAIGTLFTFDKNTHWAKWNIFALLGLVSAVVTIWFGIIYFRNRKQITTVINGIRNPDPDRNGVTSV